jgi:lycopene cyclase domain-containing protein
MSYGVFLLIFVVPPMLFFAWRMRDRMNRRIYMAFAGLIALCVIYTTPWDNYLVASGVWYYDPKLVLGLTFGYVPAEEYTFFVVQTLMTGFFMLFLWRRFYREDWGE